MSKIRPFVFLGLVVPAILLLLAVLAGCDTGDRQRQFEAEAMALPQGITRTDEDGNLVRGPDGRPVEEDPDDWRTAPLYIGTVSFQPAFPNPTRGQDVHIDFIVRFEGIAGGLTLRGYDDRGFLIMLDRIDVPQGARRFTFSPVQFSSAGALATVRGLHRVWIFDDRGSIVSYGDILVE